MNPGPNVDQRSGPIQLKPLWFLEHEKGKLLLDCLRKHAYPSEASPDAGSRFLEVLEIIKDKRSPGSLDRNVRELWRKDRIDLYDNLMLIILGAENDDWELWQDVYELNDAFENRISQSGSIYKYMLDHIHEHDDIMFKYYRAKESNHLYRRFRDLSTTYFWFYQSMERYRLRLIRPVTDIMKKWNEENEKDCQKLLEDATKKFNDTVLSGAASWRYTARMCWVLSRFQHASIRKGYNATYKFKNSEHHGPVSVLCQKIIAHEHKILLENDEGRSLVEDHSSPKVKYVDKVKKLVLGTLHCSSLLAYACARNELVLVKCILKSKKEFEKQADCDYKWEERWKKEWAKALWNAAYKGHGLIVKELILECSELYSTKYYESDNKSVQPLHVAVLRGHESVVNAFCTAKSNSINCHEEEKRSMNRYTPLEVATDYLKDDPDKKKRIQSILLNKPEVKRAVEESYSQRELTVSSANAIMVGAALIAGVTYAGWLQPPLGYHPYYQFTEPVPGAPDAPLTYMFVQGHTAIRVFAIFNSLSFFFAIAAIVAGMETTCFIEEVEETYMVKKVKRLRIKLKRTRNLFAISVIFVLIAFSSAAIAILPPIKLYQKDMYISIGVGGFVCVVFIGKMLLFGVSKRRLFNKAKEQLSPLFATVKDKFSSACGSSPCWKGLKTIKR